jgi:hypothetical protein
MTALYLIHERMQAPRQHQARVACNLYNDLITHTPAMVGDDVKQRVAGSLFAGASAFETLTACASRSNQLLALSLSLLGLGWLLGLASSSRLAWQLRAIQEELRKQDGIQQGSNSKRRQHYQATRTLVNRAAIPRSIDKLIDCTCDATYKLDLRSP